MKKTNLVSIFIFIILLAVSSGLMGIDYFVRTDGDDGNDGSADDSSHAWLTIQNAVNTVADPTTATIIIYVANGTYTLYSNGIDINRSFNNLTIQGGNKILTIIQAETTSGTATDRVFEIFSGETVTIKDMTIQNGSASQGGGVYFENSGTLNNCLLSWNSGRWGGGAFFFYGGSMINCIFSNNSSEDDGGGAYFEYGGTMDNCTFSDNIATDEGGGVYFSNGGTIVNSTLSGNSATGYGGGGVYFNTGGSMNECTLDNNTTTGNGAGVYFETSGSMNECTLSNNTATGEGGSVYFYFGGILTNCFLYGNSADYGGGVYFNEGGIFNNCLLYENSADYGGGSYLYYGGVMNNCTLSKNTSTANGGGAYLDNDNVWYTESLLNNCILWGNTAVGTGNDIYISDQGTVLYTCAFDGVVNGVNDCITSDPLFVETSSNNFHLEDNSPCIGDASATYAPAIDIENNPRGNPPDMGAYENENDAPLPVNLSSFYATYIGSIPTLYWTTQTESENAYWNVYRGVNNNFEESVHLNANDPVPGNGTTNNPSDYIYIDSAPVIQNTTYWYWIEDVSIDGETEVHEPITLEIPFEDIPITPDTYGLHQNYPNPFNPSTSISFNLPQESNVELIIYNIKGEKVKQLVNCQLPIGEHSIIWNGEDTTGTSVSSGVYLYKLICKKSSRCLQK